MLPHLVTITADMWMNDYHRINYLGMTVHYIKNFKLIIEFYCTIKYECDLSKTGENIKKFIIQLLHQFNVYDDTQNVVFVTERESNMIAALKSIRWLNCTAHIINTVLEYTMCFHNMKVRKKHLKIQF